jgi:hypothetical protein
MTVQQVCTQCSADMNVYESLQQQLNASYKLDLSSTIQHVGVAVLR